MDQAQTTVKFKLHFLRFEKLQNKKFLTTFRKQLLQKYLRKNLLKSIKTHSSLNLRLARLAFLVW